MNPAAAVPILVVDDYPIIVRILRNLLCQAGFEDVDDASDGEEALTKMRARKYGLVLSDWHMAPLSGLELLKQAKADDLLRDTPFIIVSAHADAENLVAAKHAGASAYIVKPFDALTLKTRIARVFEAR